MARSGEEGQVHPGADDNASGTAAVLELAASLAQERLAHPGSFTGTLIFALWSREEIGLLGKRGLCRKNRRCRKEKIVALRELRHGRAVAGITSSRCRAWARRSSGGS